MRRAMSVEIAKPSGIDLSTVVDRVLIFDEFFPETQLLLVEQWALNTPHWMLTNSVYDNLGRARHRIWGASYIQAWQQHGWHGLPPVLFSTLAIVFQKLGIVLLRPEYIGLNGQSQGQHASIHIDCGRGTPNQISLLVYIGENTDGDLLLYDRDAERLTDRVGYRPNRVVVLDGSIPHQARAPSDDRFRMSIIARGTYEYRPATLASAFR
jgi:hypothetical protein